MKDAMVVALSREARIVNAAARACGTHVTVEISGMGPIRARIAAQRQVAAGATALISVGFAGALRAPLGVGDLLLPREVVASAGRRYATDATMQRDLRDALCPQFRVHQSAMTSVDHVVADVARKGALAHSLNVDAVDMESAAIACVADDAGIPFAVLRVVCDGPLQRIPHCTEGAVDALGRVILARLGIGLALRPWELFDLIRLGSGVARAGCVRGRALRTVFDLQLKR